MRFLDLVAKVARANNTTQAETDRIIRGFIHEVKSSLLGGLRVTVPDLGTLKTKTRAGRTVAPGFSKRGEKMVIGPTRSIILKPCPTLKKSLADSARKIG